MAKITDTSVEFSDHEINLLRAIRMPHSTNRFGVYVVDDSLQIIPEFERITTEMIRVSPINMGKKFFGLLNNHLTFTFSDDVRSELFKTIQNLPKRFTLLISHLDGNNKSLRSYKLSNVKVTSVEVSALDFSKSDVSTIDVTIAYRSPRILFIPE